MNFCHMIVNTVGVVYIKVSLTVRNNKNLSSPLTVHINLTAKSIRIKDNISSKSKLLTGRADDLV